MATKKTPAPKSAAREDGFQNLITGFATTRDKRMSTTVSRTPKDIASELDTLFQDEALVYNMCAIPAEEMTREWVDLQGEGAAVVEDGLNLCEAQRAAHEAIMWSRLYGSAITVVGLTNQDKTRGNDGVEFVDLSKPRVRGEPVWLKTYDCFQVTGVDLGPSGEVETYRLVTADGKSTAIHHSRVLRLDADPVPARLREKGGWGQSTVRRARDAVRDLVVAQGGVSVALTDFDQAVLKLDKLTELLAADKDKAVRNRLELLDLSRSLFRMMTLDKNDEFINVARNFGSVPELIDRLVERVASVARMPVSLLMGRSPAGLNATGDADVRWWYAHIRAQQNTKLRPWLNKLIRMIAEYHAVEAPTLDFSPLWSPTEEEKARTHLTQAQADMLYLEAGVVDVDELTRSRFSSTGYSTETTIDPARLEPKPIDTDDLPEDDIDLTGENAPAPAEVDVQKMALNGAQVTSAQGIVTAVAKGELPRDAGIALLALAFQLSDAEATKVMGSAGSSFKPAAPEANASEV